MADHSAPPTRTTFDFAAVALAVAQFAPTANSATNLGLIDELLIKAVARGAQIIVFPEYSSAFIDPFDETLSSVAEPLDGPFVSGLIELAARHGVHIVAGVLERASDGARVHNTVVAVNARGVCAKYRKLHLYDAFGQRESDWVQPGAIAEPETFVAHGMRCGLMTCYDLRFPEVARTLADAGVDVALVPAEWVRGPLKEHHWVTLLTARAIENTIYVAAADHPPPLGVGLSMIIDPAGVHVAALGTTTDVAIAHLQRAEIDRVRRVNPALQLRRFRVVPA